LTLTFVVGVQAEDLKRKKDEQDYIDPAKSAEANELGKQFFQAGKWVDAIGHYTEAIKRNPKDAKLYSNRAACFTKLMTWGAAIEDCDHCIKLEPTFVKAYTRKGRIQHAMKDYHKALSTFQEALKIDPQNQDALDALATTRAAISEANATGEVDPERQKRAMEDPEIQAILKDPVMSRILNDMQTNPASAQGALKDPVVRAKLDKLIAAGIIRVG
jgi:stress-induced-phosphoprotein 1